MDLDTDVDRRHVKRPGIDENRFGIVPYLRDPDTRSVQRVKHWSIACTDLDDGTVDQVTGTP
ncbi:hypothetical protein [uncultured Serinicoccus sp.]|uniref:hypothetical protein n=1 Tax=uncultured Serinicoccus sp. TaxID=735514 RepID=UPI0026167C43|nr:hypothetical protein [uncultured Serinicoccus sp.]